MKAPEHRYWEGLFEVIERTLNPRLKRTPAPPSKRITKRKPKVKAKKCPPSKVARKAKKATRKTRAKSKRMKVAGRAKKRAS